ncbi:MAG: hypothetical protein H6684_12265 [Deltaproteobacteria bacterium]|nr:hypothetical protein [Deltaproteobacteria bacterium]MCB9489500.1 hypothetical protein [Deltaproteobacteria bacterium]
MLLALALALILSAAVACGGDDDDDDSSDDDVAADDDTSDDDTVDDDTADDDTMDDDDDDDTSTTTTTVVTTTTTTTTTTIPPVAFEVPEGCNPLATSEDCQLPYPNTYYMVEDETTPTGLRLHLESSFVDTGNNPAFDMTPLNYADGTPPSSPILIHFGKDIQRRWLLGQDEFEKSLESDFPIAVIDLMTGERHPIMIEMDANRKSLKFGRYALIIRPMVPLKMGGRYAVVLTNEVKDDKRDPLPRSQGFDYLRDGIVTTSPELEGLRDRYEEMFDTLEEKAGFARDDLLLAFDIQVASVQYVLGPISQMRQEVFDQADTGGGFTYVIDEVEDNPNENVARIVEGRFYVPHFLNSDNELVWDADHNPLRRSEDGEYPFTIVIPKVAEQGDSLPMAIFGHGIFGTGSGYLHHGGSTTRVIHEFAQEAGVILFATDWIGLSGGDLDAIIDGIVPDLNNIHIVTDRLAQSLVNNLTLIELGKQGILQDDQIRVHDGAPMFNGEDVYYYGVSLGGIQGSSLVSISRDITRGVLAVPGASWSNMLVRSIVYTPIKLVLDVKYRDPLAQQIFISGAQSLFDFSDPINLGQLILEYPYDDSPTDRIFIFQEAIGDSQVPNMVTRMLARSVGAKQLVPAVERVWGLDATFAPTTETVYTQYALPIADGKYPPEENVPPSSENGVHYNMNLLDNVADQIITLIEDGEVDQFCDGPCDPD